MTGVDPGAAALWPSPPPQDDSPAGGRVRRALGRAVPAVVLAGLLAWLFDPWLGVLVLLAATVLTVVSLLSPAAARGIERAMAAVGLVVGRVISIVVLSLVFVVGFVPVGLISRLVRRDPLASNASRPGTDWLERWGWRERRLPDRTYASEQDLLGGRRSGRVVWAVGLVAVLLLADLAVGTLLGGPDPGTGEAPADEAGGGPTDIPALAGLDYVPQLFTEQFAAESGEVDPLVGWRLADMDGTHMDMVDGERASRRTEAPGDPVVVWFFGGSGMYGFGQRDDHTIASELVALAEDEGVAVEAHNFGTPAYVNWQGVALFSQLVTEREPPDVAVFYDGYNDLSMQLVDGPVSEPSHVLARVHRDRLTAPPPAATPTDAADVRAWWADHSGAVSLWRRVRDRLDEDEPRSQLTEADASAVPADVDEAAVEAATADLLRRGRDLASAIGDQYGIEVRFWFQPTLFTKGAVEGEAQLIARAANRSPAWEPVTEALRADLAAAGVVDLGDALDGTTEPLFWDVVHTNEAGARLVAEAAWPSLRDAIGSSTG